MKLRTSYFNGSVFRKNMTRFAPAWVLYMIAELLVIVTLRGNNGSHYSFASDMGYSLQGMGVINLCYALLVGQLLFGDLYNARMCNALHAMPMRREGWFITNILSGIAFSVVPNAVGALFASVLMGQYWYIAFVWLLCVTLQYLFFFGVAVFSAYSVGNRFAMALVYGLVNFLSILAYWLVVTFYEPALYGIEIALDPFTLLCPVIRMIQNGYIDRISDGVRDTLLQINGEGMLYLCVCAAVGLVCIGVALLFYRRRALECAGDFIAVKPLAPVFLTLYSLCAGAALHLFWSLFIGDENLVFMFIGVTIGFFTGRMLLDRTLRVFHKKTFAGLGIFAAVFALSILLAQIDPLGITRWVPKAENIQQVTVSNYYSSWYVGVSEESVAFTDPTDIAKVVQIHQHGVNNRYEGDNGVADVRISISYTLKNGTTAQRNYYIDSNTEAGKLLEGFMSRPEYALGFRPANQDSVVKDTRYVYISTGYELYEEKEIESLLLAMIQDCEAGNMAQHYSFHEDEETVIWIDYSFENRNGAYVYQNITIYSSCEHTLAWLEEKGYLEDNYE